MPQSAAPTRRQQRRDATLAEIRAAARTALAANGSDAVSLRGIAANLGMAPAGVHYYFPARDDLIAALIVEAFDELAAISATAVEDQPGGPSAWVKASVAYRAWALDNPELFSLAHSATAARLKDRPGLLDAKDRAVRALIGPLEAAVATGQVNPPMTPHRISAGLRSQLRAWTEAAGVPRDQRLLLYLLQAYTVVQGSVLLTITGSLPQELLVGDGLFRAQLDLVLGVGSPR